MVSLLQSECEVGWQGTVGRQSLLAWVAWRYSLFATDNDRKRASFGIAAGGWTREYIVFLNTIKHGAIIHDAHS